MVTEADASIVTEVALQKSLPFLICQIIPFAKISVRTCMWHEEHLSQWQVMWWTKLFLWVLCRRFRLSAVCSSNITPAHKPGTESSWGASRCRPPSRPRTTSRRRPWRCGRCLCWAGWRRPSTGTQPAPSTGSSPWSGPGPRQVSSALCQDSHNGRLWWVTVPSHRNHKNQSLYHWQNSLYRVTVSFITIFSSMHL